MSGNIYLICADPKVGRPHNFAFYKYEDAIPLNADGTKRKNMAFWYDGHCPSFIHLAIFPSGDVSINTDLNLGFERVRNGGNPIPGTRSIVIEIDKSRTRIEPGPCNADAPEVELTLVGGGPTAADTTH